VASREDLLAVENSDAGKAAAEALRAFLNTCDDETIAPSAGLNIRAESVVSHPDGNKINIQFIRPDNAARVPCVYYIHRFEGKLLWREKAAEEISPSRRGEAEAGRRPRSYKGALRSMLAHTQWHSCALSAGDGNYPWHGNPPNLLS
jgi:hypothetical protein